MDTVRHTMAGVLIILIGSYILVALDLAKYAPYMFVLVFGVIAPDILEPATSAFHRGFFHSKLILGFLIICGLGIFFIFGINWMQACFFGFFFVIGDILHLVQDSTTPAGLP